MKVRSYEEFHTNIKGLPEGEYLTETGYSQSYPWKVVGKTATTLKVIPVNTQKDPEWEPNVLPGGFAGHCTNQSEQTWLYDGVMENIEPVTLRLKKSRYCSSDKLWGDKHGREFIANGAVYFYDYNF